MIGRSNGHKYREVGGDACVGLRDVHDERTAVGDGGAFGETNDEGRVLCPCGKHVRYRGINGKNGPWGSETALVDGDVVGLDGRTVVLNVQRDVGALARFKNGVLDIHREKDGVVSRNRHHEGREAHGHQSENTEHGSACSAGHDPTKATLFKRLRAS